MASVKKNGETADINTLDLSVDDTSKWVEEQVGFAPYWNPEEGKWFIAQVIGRDERDPDFTRYLMRARMNIPCKRGPVDDAEDVAIKPGEHFSVSVYYSLRDLFDFYLESGINPPMRVTAVKQVKTKTIGQKCWTWGVVIPPEYKTKVEAARLKAAEMKRLSDAAEFPPKEMTQ